MLATQNRPVLERNGIPPPGPGQIRHWVDRTELSLLLSKRFEVTELLSITRQFDHGYLRFVNSRKLRSFLSKVGLNVVNEFVKRQQEKAWLGWTLMALARKL